MAKYHRHDERNKRRGKKERLVEDEIKYDPSMKTDKRTKYKQSVTYDIDDYYYQEVEPEQDF